MKHVLSLVDLASLVEILDAHPFGTLGLLVLVAIIAWRWPGASTPAPRAGRRLSLIHI